MSIVRWAVVAILYSAALVASAQQPSPFGEVLEVSVTNVDIVVTGKDGQPVPGLKPSDFEVYENGKKQNISHFAELGRSGGSAFLVGEEGAAPQQIEAAPVPRKFIFYLDDSSLGLENRRVIFPALQKFLATHLRPGDEAMIANWNRSLKVRVPWTTDLAAINTELEKLGAEAPASPYIYFEKQRIQRLMSKIESEAGEANNNNPPSFGEIESAARGYADAYILDLQQSTNALVRLLASLSGVDGKKVIVIATETMPTVAGGEIFAHLEEIRARAMVSNNSLRAGAAGGSRITNLNRYNVQPMLDLIARSANATGVTVYGINPKGLDGPASGKADLQMYREASVEFARVEHALAGIKFLANITGGTAMIGAPADMALEKVGRDLDAYYSIGYRSAPGAKAERKIEVRATRPGLNVRTRTNVFYRTLEREMADRVIANHLQSKPVNELGISLETDPVRNEGSKNLLPVRVVIPVSKLTLIPDGKGGVTGGFSVFTCSGDGEGATSGVNVQSQAINFTAEQAEQMKGRRIGFAIQVPVEKAKPQVSIGVVDHVSQSQGFAMLKATL